MRNPFSKLTKEKKVARKNTHLHRDPSSFDRRGNRSSGDQPLMQAQEFYLEQLPEDAGESLGQGLTRSQASNRIDELKSRRPDQ